MNFIDSPLTEERFTVLINRARSYIGSDELTTAAQIDAFYDEVVDVLTLARDALTKAPQ